MAAIAPAVTGVTFKATVTEQTTSPIVDITNINIPINFADAANVKVISGQYTPANDTHSIIGGLGLFSPNFYIFLCDQPVVLSTDNSFLASEPINRFAMSTFVPLVDGENPIGSFVLNGQTAEPYPMQQGVLVNYTLIIGQAVIT